MNFTNKLSALFFTGALIAFSACNNASAPVESVKCPADTAVADSLGFKAIDVRTQFAENPFTFFDGDGLLLAAGKKDSMNAMTIGWGQLGTLWCMQRPVVNVYVRKSRYTDKFMAENEYFTVTGFSKDYADALRYMGTHSGREGDKVKAAGLNAVFTKLGNPYFKEARIVLECKKLYQAPLQPAGFGDVAKEVYQRDSSIHNVYIGEVVNAWVK